MRIVSRMEEMEKALSASQSEARKAFGNDQVFVERYLPNPRHVEVQVLADHHGNIIHLGERECSIQRRYQKIIEETPSTVVEDSLRREMGRMACALAREAGYTNAGTVEFILDRDGKFYFLEMNTRLQVEHPVTEMVTSLDLVELQIRIASGEPLPLKQQDVSFRGWAIEVRVCAEDPERGFLPSTGMITRYYEPRGPCIRVDSGIEAGSIVSSYYDSLLAKVVAWGNDREEARTALIDGLNGYHIEGVQTNVSFANAVLTHPAFVKGDLSTGFIEEHFQDGQAKIKPPAHYLHYMALAATLVYHNRQNLVRASLRPMAAQVGGVSPFKPRYEYVVKGGDDALELRLQQADPASRQLGSVGRRTSLPRNNAPVRVLPPTTQARDRRQVPSLPAPVQRKLHPGHLLRDQPHLGDLHAPRMETDPLRADSLKEKAHGQYLSLVPCPASSWMSRCRRANGFTRGSSW